MYQLISSSLYFLFFLLSKSLWIQYINVNNGETSVPPVAPTETATTLIHDCCKTFLTYLTKLIQALVGLKLTEDLFGMLNFEPTIVDQDEDEGSGDESVN